MLTNVYCCSIMIIEIKKRGNKKMKTKYFKNWDEAKTFKNTVVCTDCGLSNDWEKGMYYVTYLC